MIEEEFRLMGLRVVRAPPYIQDPGSAFFSNSARTERYYLPDEGIFSVEAFAEARATMLRELDLDADTCSLGHVAFDELRRDAISSGLLLEAEIDRLQREIVVDESPIAPERRRSIFDTTVHLHPEDIRNPMPVNASGLTNVDVDAIRIDWLRGKRIMFHHHGDPFTAGRCFFRIDFMGCSMSKLVDNYSIRQDRINGYPIMRAARHQLFQELREWVKDQYELAKEIPFEEEGSVR